MVRHHVRKRFPWPERALAELPRLAPGRSLREIARALHERGLVRALPDPSVVRRALAAGKAHP
jgi:hypothetical protein